MTLAQAVKGDADHILRNIKQNQAKNMMNVQEVAEVLSTHWGHIHMLKELDATQMVFGDDLLCVPHAHSCHQADARTSR